MKDSPSPLVRWERLGLVLLLLVLIVWGGLVEYRSAFLKRRMTDAVCFFRAAWMVRTGGPLYDFTDDNGWHYNYPPVFAILMTPLADAPVGEDRTGLLSYPVLVAVWYVLSVIFLAVGIHWLASALEERAAKGPAPWDSRRWWALRLFPMLVCLPPIGHSLMRGQSNMLLLLLLCGVAAATLRGQRWRSGLCLAGAICLKVYPAFLVIYPLWRRDRRALAGCAVGLLIGLVLIPAAHFGIPKTWDLYEQYAQVLLGPALGIGSDTSRDKEIIHSTANDSQSLQATIHNTLYPEFKTRPPVPAPAVVWGARLLSGAMLLLTLLAGGLYRSRSAPAEVVFFGCLIVVMLLASPLCHTHYFTFLVILVTGLTAARWERRPDLLVGWPVTLIQAASAILYVLCNLPSLEFLRDLGVIMYPALALWGLSLSRLGEPMNVGSVPMDAREPSTSQRRGLAA
jgi:hypothetical protein